MLPISGKRTKFTLVPTSGKVGGGNRNSNVFTNAAVPPTGNPVCKSRGPAPLIGKPRSEFAPPAYSRSGSGTALQLGLVVSRTPAQASLPTLGFGPDARSYPMRVLRANTYFSLPNW